MAAPIVFPKEWNLSIQQDYVLGILADYPSKYISPQEMCSELYDEKYEKPKYNKMPAPAKLRVLVQRCREILNIRTNNKVKIEIVRNTGWRMTEESVTELRRIIAHK